MTAEGMYTIKEAAKKVHVEAHALRYWEEELGLSISRNDQGYRQYSEEDMELLERVRQWKEKGMQLKAIRLMLSENGRLSVPQEIVREAQSMLEKGDAGAAAAAGSRRYRAGRAPDGAGHERKGAGRQPKRT